MIRSAALEKPLWWLALAAMVLNDHWLKGSGLLPGWLTGKISDFAFLLVAPGVLYALLPMPRHAVRRLIACLMPSGLLIAVELSSLASNALVAIMQVGGIVWQLWPDPTDLLALSVLPLAWMLLRSPAPRGTAWPRAVHAAGVTLGAIACVATSEPHYWEHEPFLVNQHVAEVPIELTWSLKSLPCDVPLAEASASLQAADFDAARSIRLAPGQIAALDWPPRPDRSPVAVCSNLQEGGLRTDPSHIDLKAYPGPGSLCTGLVIEMPGQPPELIRTPPSWFVYDKGPYFWSDRPCANGVRSGDDPGPAALRIVNQGGQLILVVPRQVSRIAFDVARLTQPIDTSLDSCRVLRERLTRITEMPCASDDDCSAEPSTCGDVCFAHVVRSSIDEAKSTWTSFARNQCRSAACPCAPGNPAICVMGRCSAECPAWRLPTCPRCDEVVTGQRCGEAETRSGTCANASGLVCDCLGPTRGWFCRERPPGCAVGCLVPGDRDGGTSQSHDGGVQSARD